jgi:magnesium transporter
MAGSLRAAGGRTRQTRGMASVARTRVWHDGQLTAKDFPLADVSDYLAEPGAVVWADLVRPDAQTLDQLGEELSLDQLAIEDATTLHERPKAVRYQSHLFVTAFAVGSVEADSIAVSRVSAFVLPQGLVTVRLDDEFDMDAVVQRWEDNSDLIAAGPLALLHGLLDQIVDEYFTAVGAMDDRIDALEDLLFDDRSKVSHNLQRETFAIRKALVHLRKVTLPMREVVTTILRRVVERDEHSMLVPYYEDLYDHTLRAAEWTDSLRDLLTSVFETSLSLSDTRMNTIMKKLTAWAAIIAVPTAITGWYGQNVPYPGFGREWGVIFSFSSIMLIALALYATFKRKDWL